MSCSGPPVVSVIVPAFNTSHYIQSTLESLARQTYRDFEVLVVDDGSRDDTMAKAVGDISRLSLVGSVSSRPERMKKGVASCRNHGVAQAAANWIAFLDSDDLFEPRTLERIVSLIRSGVGGPVAIHHGVVRFDDKTGEVLGSSSSIGGAEPFPSVDELIARNSIATSTVVVHRRCLSETGGFDTRLNGVEDYWLWLRIAKRWRWCYEPETLVRYRVRDDSLMNGKSFTHYVDQYTTLSGVAAESGELSDDELRAFREGLFSRSLRFYAGEVYRAGGMRALLPGLFLLTRRGHPAAAAQVLYRESRAIALRGAQRVYRAASRASAILRS